MKFNGAIPVPLFSTAKNQANIQIPWELQGLSSADLTTVGADGATATFPVTLSRFAPAIFSVNQQGTGQGMVTISNSGTVAAPPCKYRWRDDAGGHKGRFHHHLLRRSGARE
ncbi:MAG: hypothetical protein WDO73_31980 [Ignavibacteriota bacterium]